MSATLRLRPCHTIASMQGLVWRMLTHEGKKRVTKVVPTRHIG